MESSSTQYEPDPKRRKIVNGSSHVNSINHKSKDLLKHVKVGSRKSQLALFQTNYVVDLLRKHYSGLTYDIESMATTGDKVLDVALSKIGEKSLFTKELEVALEKQEVHMVVHSLKDLPTSLPAGMVIGAICKRENPYDVVVFKEGCKYSDLKDLPDGSTIGTSSLRRTAQLKRAFPKLNFESVRGNLNTRLRKLDEDEKYSALILAAAGLSRLDLEHRIGKILSSKVCMYAVGQGALAIECREDDSKTIDLISCLSDEETTLCCIAERAFMKALEGGCSVPIGVNSYLKDKMLTLEGGVFSLDGTKYIRETLNCDVYNKENGKNKKHYTGIVSPEVPDYALSSAEGLGEQLAELFLSKGASEILKEARTQGVALPPPVC